MIGDPENDGGLIAFFAAPIVALVIVVIVGIILKLAGWPWS